MSAHTPGPWKAVSAAVCAEIQMMEIAEVSHMRVVPAAGGWPTPGAPEDDARLISAAPDLLEALKLILPDAEADDYGGADIGERLAKARAAIAKAEGQA